MQMYNSAGYALSAPMQETKYVCGGVQSAQYKGYPHTIAAVNFVQIILLTFSFFYPKLSKWCYLKKWK